MATTLLPPTPITIPSGITAYPSANGGNLPAGEHNVNVSVDTANMPTSATVSLAWEFQFSGDAAWYQQESGSFSGGSRLARDGVTQTTMWGEGVSIQQSPYPARWRVVCTANEASPVTVSATSS